MRRLLLAATVALLPLTAHAELFDVAAPYTFDATGVNGGDVSTTAHLNTATQVLSPTLILDTTIVPTAGGGEWLVFDLHTNDGQPLSGSNVNFDMREIGLTALVPVNFDAGFNAADINGVNQVFASSPFQGFTPQVSPLFGPGVGNTFNAPFPAGGLGPLFSFLDPFGILNGNGLPADMLTSFEQAWHFDPQSVVSTPEPATLVLLGAGLLGLVFARRQA
jgi:hypothetical protein